MNVIIKAPFQAPTLSVEPLKAGLSPELQAAIAAWRAPSDGTWKRFSAPAPVIQEASEALGRLDLLETRRPDEVDVARWLTSVADCVRPLPADEFDRRVGAVLRVCGDLPACLFNEATATRAGATFRFFPSAAEVRAFLEDQGAPLRIRRRALAAVARAREQAPPWPDVAGPGGSEQVAAVTGALRAKREPTGNVAAPVLPVRSRGPAPIPDEVLKARRAELAAAFLAKQRGAS